MKAAKVFLPYNLLSHVEKRIKESLESEFPVNCALDSLFRDEEMNVANLDQAQIPLVKE